MYHTHHCKLVHSHLLLSFQWSHRILLCVYYTLFTLFPTFAHLDYYYIVVIYNIAVIRVKVFAYISILIKLILRNGIAESKDNVQLNLDRCWQIDFQKCHCTHISTNYMLENLFSPHKKNSLACCKYFLTFTSFIDSNCI